MNFKCELDKGEYSNLEYLQNEELSTSETLCYYAQKMATLNQTYEMKD